MEYYNHDIKQPGDRWLPGRFLGITWESGDSMTYYVETKKPPGSGRNSILIRSTVCPRPTPSPTPSTSSSGETLLVTNDKNYESLITLTNKDAVEPSTNNVDPIPTNDDINRYPDPTNDQEPDLAPDDAAIADEQVVNHIHQNDDGMDFVAFSDHRWDNGNLILKIQLESGQHFEAPFTQLNWPNISNEK